MEDNNNITPAAAAVEVTESHAQDQHSAQVDNGTTFVWPPPVTSSRFVSIALISSLYASVNITNIYGYTDLMVMESLTLLFQLKMLNMRLMLPFQQRLFLLLHQRLLQQLLPYYLKRIVLLLTKRGIIILLRMFICIFYYFAFCLQDYVISSMPKRKEIRRKLQWSLIESLLKK